MIRNCVSPIPFNAALFSEENSFSPSPTITKLGSLVQSAGFFGVQPQPMVVYDGQLYQKLVLEMRQKVEAYLINMGIYDLNPNQFDAEGGTPLTWAVCDNDVTMVRLLLNFGADPNFCDREGGTPLSWAVSGNNPALVQLLVNLRANPNQSDGEGCTPLTRAVNESNFPMVQLLMTLGANPNQSDGDGYTPLTRAVNESNFPMVQLLRTLGADPNQSDLRGLTSVTQAVENDNHPMVCLLHALGANVDQIDIEKFTPLTRAVRNCNLPMVSLLKRLGAHINLCDGYGLSPLTGAVKMGNHHAVNILKKLGALLDLSDLQGLTPLTQAVFKNNPLMVELLKNLGASLNQLDGRGLTPIGWAVAMRNFEMVQKLKELGADLNACDGNGWVPLALSRCLKEDAMKKWVVQLGADEALGLDCYYQKMVAAAWGLEGVASLRGFSQLLPSGSIDFGFSILIESLTAFFKEEREIPVEIRDKESLILETLDQAFPHERLTARQIMERVESGKPTLIGGGAIQHAVVFLLYNGMIAVCNRGVGREKESAITFYPLPKDMSEKFIKELMQTQKSLQDYCAMIQKLGPKIEKLGIQQVDQHTGNCFLTSPKSAIYALASCLCPKKAKEFYKRFSAYLRKYALKEYYKHIPTERLNPHILLLVKDKLVKKLDEADPKPFYDIGVFNDLEGHISQEERFRMERLRKMMARPYLSKHHFFI